MKHFLGTMAALIMAALTHAQVTVKGRVVDEQGKPLAKAQVQVLANLKVPPFAFTDDSGFFSFPKMPGRGYVLVDYVGKHNALKPYALIQGQSTIDLSIVMLDSAYYLEPLEIKAVRAADKAPFTKTDLNSGQIQKNNLGQDIPYLINQTPSVYVSSDAGNGVGYTYMHIRGTDATRINVTLNGIPYNDAESQGTYFVDLPDILSSTNSIQIQRGVGTSTNGAGAFGATINLNTFEFHDSAYAESNNSYGSFNTWKNTVRVGTGLINNHFTVDARFSQISSDGYIDRAKSNLQAMYLSAAYINKKTSVRFNLIAGKEKTYQAWYGVDSATLATDRKYNYAGTEKPGTPYDNETDNYWQTHYQLFFDQAINKYWSFGIASFLTRGYGYYEEYKAAQAYGDYGLSNPVIGSDTVTQTDLVRQLWLDNYFYGQVFSVQYKKNKDEVTLGGSWTTYTGKHYGELVWGDVGIPRDDIYYNYPAKKTDMNVYAKWLRAINDKWSAFGDIQYRHVMHNMEGFDGNPDLFIRRKFDFVNPKAGISYNHLGWSGYFSYAMANKEPNRDDFQASLEQQPKKETLHDFELGIGQKLYNYSWNVTLYDMIYKDQLVLTGKLNDVGNYTRINVPNSYRVGIELQGSYNFNPWLNASANLTISRNKIKTFTEYLDNYDDGTQEAIQHNNTDISFSPAVIGGFAVNITPGKNLEISLPGKYVSSQYLDNTQNEQRRLGAFYTQGLMASYTFYHLLFKEWCITAQLNNIFNNLYQPNGATYPYIYGGAVVNDNYYYPVAGINYMLSVNVKF
ncbi:MAG TPA: TonB-dependent receptor [Chitinophagaceae bacterium]|nr:TonB-dependent receptor [Chitinophagaceae bacterium]